MGGPSGFHGALFMKGLMISNGLATLGAHAWQLRSGGIDLSWRLLTHQLVSATNSEFLFGLIVLYQFRLFERHYGSRKFVGRVVIVSLASTLLQIAAAPTLLPLLVRLGLRDWERSDSSYGGVSSGPYGAIFALLVPFFLDVPATGLFRLAGIPLSSKSFVYFLCAQLAFANSPHSALAALCGIAAGTAYHFNVAYVQALQIPAGAARKVERAIAPLLASPPPRLSSLATRQAQQAELHAQLQAERARVMPGAGAGAGGNLRGPYRRPGGDGGGARRREQHGFADTLVD